ncbi:MAG: ABC transporter permease [Huintestinicola sp.]
MITIISPVRIIHTQIKRIKENWFLFEELVKRDFKKKYKNTVLGMLWSLLSPLMMLTVMALVFKNFFGRNIEHFIIYLFCGNLVYSYFSESTSSGMTSLVANAGIFSKINVPKYMFLMSKNVSSLINFGLTLVIFFVFVIIDKVPITPYFLLLLFPILCLIVFNLGMGLILSALYVMFRDMKYLYDIFKQALMYFSAIFYSTASFSDNVRPLFRLNPIYVYIEYFRTIVLEARVPDLQLHLLAIGYAAVVFVLGAVMYYKNNYKFLYYI